ncbi:LLM class F420-dependent oxidoreductase [Saccharothrix violaceirubra]|uniref:Putative F420-dependent oxidoreductase n=1 Tax=Saccharothrix violaceirubra TaxID=413306 RepID=A0A7W7WZK0_9PSEU|nr:LLM class F420-dependent oxidoreductase [Saccharothrix violaceirubra]MBB4969485.1 putative F420-dependent oxidoreductase [Saccharothrix violaceirubra]
MTVNLGEYGAWGLADVWPGREEEAAELESLGYGALWLGGPSARTLDTVRELIEATSTLTVATGILNVWATPVEQVNERYRELAWTDRFLVGVGIGHPETNGEVYHSPYQKLVDYLDRLDVPRDRLALAALGPRVLRLAAARTSVAHPYLTTPEHTAQARETIGAGVLLAPEQHVVLETDPDAAREIGRGELEFYLGLENYRANWLRGGFTADDFADGGSDRLVDALIAWGTVEQVVARVRAHRDAGADHVCLQVVGQDGVPLPAYRELAAALF